MSCSRTQHSDAGEARTRGPSILSQALYHWATALPFKKCNSQTLKTSKFFQILTSPRSLVRLLIENPEKRVTRDKICACMRFFGLKKVNILLCTLQAHLIAGYHRPTSETPFKWRFVDGPIVAPDCTCMLARVLREWWSVEMMDISLAAWHLSINSWKTCMYWDDKRKVTLLASVCCTMEFQLPCNYLQ